MILTDGSQGPFGSILGWFWGVFGGVFGLFMFICLYHLYAFLVLFRVDVAVVSAGVRGSLGVFSFLFFRIWMFLLSCVANVLYNFILFLVLCVVSRRSASEPLPQVFGLRFSGYVLALVVG